MKNIAKIIIGINLLVASTISLAVEPEIAIKAESGPVKNGQKMLYSHGEQEKLRVLDVVHKYTQSVNQGDRVPELIDSLWEHSHDVSNINIRGHQKGFEDIKKNFYAPIFAVLKDRNLRMVTNERKPAVYIFDNTAIVEFYWELDAIIIEGNKPVHMLGRETHVMKRVRGEWKLIHLHYSGMPAKGF